MTASSFPCGKAAVRMEKKSWLFNTPWQYYELVQTWFSEVSQPSNDLFAYTGH